MDFGTCNPGSDEIKDTTNGLCGPEFQATCLNFGTKTCCSPYNYWYVAQNSPAKALIYRLLTTPCTAAIPVPIAGRDASRNTVNATRAADGSTAGGLCNQHSE